MRSVGADNVSGFELALIGKAVDGFEGTEDTIGVGERFKLLIAWLVVGKLAIDDSAAFSTLGRMSPARSASVQPPDNGAGSVGAAVDVAANGSIRN